MTDNKVEVRIGGRRFGGWKSVRIETGIEQLSRAFALEVTEKFPGSTDFGFFRNGDLVQVYIGDDLVCTGWISSTPIQYDGKSVKVQIQGIKERLGWCKGQKWHSDNNDEYESRNFMEKSVRFPNHCGFSEALRCNCER